MVFTCVVVPKAIGKWRLCVDYRKANDLTEKDSYALLYIDKIFDSLDGAKIFTTMDLYSGQILMDEENVEINKFYYKIRQLPIQSYAFWIDRSSGYLPRGNE